MGCKPWRNLSVLVLAGVALVGCNNTPQKDRSLGMTPGNPPQSKLANTAPQWPPQPNNSAFPTANSNNTAKPSTVTPIGGPGSSNLGPGAFPSSSNPGGSGPALNLTPLNNPPSSSFGPGPSNPGAGPVFPPRDKGATAPSIPPPSSNFGTLGRDTFPPAPNPGPYPGPVDIPLPPR